MADACRGSVVDGLPEAISANIAKLATVGASIILSLPAPLRYARPCCGRHYEAKGPTTYKLVQAELVDVDV